MRSTVCVILAISLWGCLSAPRLEKTMLFRRGGLDGRPDAEFKVCVPPERDYADYAAAVDKYDLISLRDRIAHAFSGDVVVLHYREGTRHFEREVPSRFTLVNNPREADIVIRIVVDVFDYGDRRTLEGKVICPPLFGGPGLLGISEQALMVGKYTVGVPGAGEAFIDERFNEFSGKWLVPREAYQKAIDRSAEAICVGLLEY